MKKLLLFICLLYASAALPQAPIVPRSGPAVTADDARVRVYLNLYVPRVHGLANALNGGLDTLGGIMYDDSSRHLWVRDTVLAGGHIWTMILKVGDAGNGTVTAVTAGLWMLPLTITTTGTLNADSSAMAAYFVRRRDSTIVFVTPTQMNSQGFLKNITGIVAGGDLTGTYPNPTIAANAVTFSKFQQLPGFGFVANPTASPSNTQASYFGYGLKWNNDTVKVDTTTLKTVFGSLSGGITQLTGDGSAGPGSGSQVFTLATVNGNVYPSNTFLKVAVNAKGLTTSATPVVIGDITGVLGFTPISLASLSATSPIVYNNSTGVFSCPTCGVSGGGISSLNTLTAANQTLVIGYAGTSFNIQDITATHTFNIPLVNSSDTGLVTPALYATWNAKINLTSISATSPISYNNSTGVISMVNSGVTPGTYTNANVTVNAFGVITGISNGSGSQTLTYNQLALDNTLSISGGNTVTFFLATHALAGLMDSASKAVVDSLRLRTYTWPVFNIYANNGVTANNDTVQLGNALDQNTTIATMGWAFNITGLPEESTLSAGDSVVIEKSGTKQFCLVPASAISSGGGVSSVSNSDGTLTISPTTGAVVASFNQAANINATGNWTFSQAVLPASASTINLGSGTFPWATIETNNIAAPADLSEGVGAGHNIFWKINSTQQMELVSTGQLILGSGSGYSFSGTPANFLAVDASGHVITTTGSTTITLTGTSGGGLSASSYTFAVSGTSTTATGLTIPGSGSTFTWTYPAAWDYGDNTRAVNLNAFWGSLTGNTTLSGQNNTAFGIQSGGALTTGQYNSFFGSQSGYPNTTGSQNAFFGWVTGFANTTGSNNTFVGAGSASSNITGSRNAYFGNIAGDLAVNGNDNTDLGNQAGGAMKNSPWGNVIIGSLARSSTNNNDSLSIEIGFKNGQSNLDSVKLSILLGYNQQNTYNVYELNNINLGNNTSLGFNKGILQNYTNIGNSVLAWQDSIANFATRSQVTTIGDSGVATHANLLTMPKYSGGIVMERDSLGTGSGYFVYVQADAAWEQIPTTWHLPAGGTSYTFANSIQNISGTVNLVGDVTSPGNSFYYGTNSSGTKGFYALPSSSSVALSSVTALTASTTIDNLNFGWTFKNSTLTAGPAAQFLFNGTTATAGQIEFNVLSEGTSATTGLTTYAAVIQDAIAGGTGSTNVALELLSSGSATSYGLIIPSTSTLNGIGTSTPTTTWYVSSGGGTLVTSATNGSGQTPGFQLITFNATGQGALYANVSNNGGSVNTGFGPNTMYLRGTGSLGVNIGAQITTGDIRMFSGGESITNLRYLIDSIGGHHLDTVTGKSQWNISSTLARNFPGAGEGWVMAMDGGIITDNNSTGTVSNVLAVASFASAAVTDVHTAVTYTNAATLYIAGAPTVYGSNTTIANSYSFYVNGGESYFGGTTYQVGDMGVLTTPTTTAALTIGLAAYNSGLGTGLVTASATSNDAITAASGNVTNMAANLFNTPTFTATNTGVTYTNAATLWIAGPVIAGTHVTITNDYAMYIQSGNIGGSNTSSAIFSHFVGNSATPSISAGTGAGTSPTVAITGTDQDGFIIITTGTLPAGSTATVVTVTFSTPFPNNTFITLTPGNGLTAALGSASVYVTGTTTTFSIISNIAGLTAATQYSWFYHVGAN